MYISYGNIYIYIKYMMANLGGQVIKSAAPIMFSRTSHMIFKQLQFNTVGKYCKFSTSTLEAENERDPAPLFFNNEIQQALKTLTRGDPAKVFRTRMDGKPISDPVYKFMTTEELDAEIAKGMKLMEEKLQMPPFIKKRTPINEILSKDPAIQGHTNSDASYVFTDITYGISNFDRFIVVRESNGLLRKANWDERFRVNQIYFPIEGRELVPPKMFQDPYLKDLMKRNEYEFVLDRACVQYDPDDPEYHRVTKVVYDNVNDSSHFNMLISTRHYGPLVFYLVWNKNINNLLLENIKNKMIEDAVLLIQLYNRINSDSKSAGIEHDGDDLKFIQKYIEMESPIRGKLTAALNAYKEWKDACKMVEDGIKKAHGVE